MANCDSGQRSNQHQGPFSMRSSNFDAPDAKTMQMVLRGTSRAVISSASRTLSEAESSWTFFLSAIWTLLHAVGATPSSLRAAALVADSRLRELCWGLGFHHSFAQALYVCLVLSSGSGLVFLAGVFLFMAFSAAAGVSALFSVVGGVVWGLAMGGAGGTMVMGASLVVPVFVLSLTSAGVIGVIGTVSRMPKVEAGPSTDLRAEVSRLISDVRNFAAPRGNARSLPYVSKPDKSGQMTASRERTQAPAPAVKHDRAHSPTRSGNNDSGKGGDTRHHDGFEISEWSQDEVEIVSSDKHRKEVAGLSERQQGTKDEGEVPLTSQMQNLSTARGRNDRTSKGGVIQCISQDSHDGQSQPSITLRDVLAELGAPLPYHPVNQETIAAQSTRNAAALQGISLRDLSSTDERPPGSDEVRRAAGAQRRPMQSKTCVDGETMLPSSRARRVWDGPSGGKEVEELVLVEDLDVSAGSKAAIMDGRAVLL